MRERTFDNLALGEDSILHFLAQLEVLSLTQLQGHTMPVTSLALNWDSSQLASGSLSGSIIVHNVLTGTSPAPFRHATSKVVLDVQC